MCAVRVEPTPILKYEPRPRLAYYTYLVYESNVALPPLQLLRYFLRVSHELYLVYIRIHAGVPGGLVGYPRAYRNQFGEFNSQRVHILVGTFSCIKID